ncbi:MAG: hypothetical protein WC732_08620 [Candidatus Omnitrophota bacterium]
MWGIYTDTDATRCETRIECEREHGSPGECREWTCDAGTCTVAMLPVNASCANAGRCTPSGVCAAALPEWIARGRCDDGNMCTIDTCEPAESSSCVCTHRWNPLRCTAAGAVTAIVPPVVAIGIFLQIF